MSAFDQFDANHDGMISRAEFNAAMGFGQPVTAQASYMPATSYAAPQVAMPQVTYGAPAYTPQAYSTAPAVRMEPQMAAQPVSYAAPSYMPAEQAQVTYAAPQAMTYMTAPAQEAPPTYAAQPVTYAAPSYMPATASATAIPTYAPAAAAQVGPSPFDQVDANHDGVISRAEFNAAMFAPSAAPPTYAPSCSSTVCPAGCSTGHLQHRAIKLCLRSDRSHHSSSGLCQHGAIKLCAS